MSEYVRKQALLEWLDDRRYKSPWIESFRERLESGAFDADESEAQRLWAALEVCRYALKNGYFQDELILRNALKAIDQALSTTTEPINAEKVERVREGDGNDA